jgi:hypothetical protein
MGPNESHSPTRERRLRCARPRCRRARRRRAGTVGADEDLGDGVERERLEARSEVTQLRDGRGAAGGDAGERVGEQA